jgi:hypothetical protein
MNNSPVLATQESSSSDPTWERLEDQIAWYDRKGSQNQRTYKRIKIVEIIAAAAIPFLSALNISQGSTNWFPQHISWTIGGLGVLITILEGMLQLNQYQQNWISYRSTCEGLKHEKYTYLAKAAPYTNVADPHALLAERVESLVSQEHAKWAAVRQPETKAKADDSGKT